MCPASIAKIPTLRERAAKLAAARSFFAKRSVLEVDAGALVRYPPLDSGIDVMSVSVSSSEIGYLHTSPEYGMKKLLVEGSGDIYFLGHVYRKGELGPTHNPEFTMAEWYRIGFSFSQMIEEACDFICLLAGARKSRVLSYQEAFERYAGLDPIASSKKDLFSSLKKFGIDLPKEAESWEKDTFLHLILMLVVEPNLGVGELTVLIDYPPHEAALACVVEKNGRLVAERFEIYGNGLELANGYHELADADELRNRFERLNQARREPYALDESFLSALQTGLFPPCCGVSVGFDRVLMLESGSKQIADVIPFAWN